MMKVVQINAVYGFASTGKIVRDLCEEIELCGFDATAVYQTAKPIPASGYRVGNPIDWKLHALHTRIFGMQGYASKSATKKLLKYFDMIRPDVVHLHN